MQKSDLPFLTSLVGVILGPTKIKYLRMDYKTGRPSKAGGRGLRLLCWGRRWAHFTCAKILIFSAMPQAEWKGLWLGVAPRPRTCFSCCVLVLKELNHVNANQIVTWKGFGDRANPYRYKLWQTSRRNWVWESLWRGYGMRMKSLPYGSWLESGGRGINLLHLCLP